MSNYVYYLFSPVLKKFYIGKTDDLQRRIKEHNQRQEIYTRKGAPWILMVYIECKNGAEAAQIENRLKRAKNKKYIKWFFEKYGKIIDNTIWVGSSTG